MTSNPSRNSGRRGASEPSVSVEVLHERLTEAVAALQTGEQWQSWLTFAQRLHQYSFKNVILIWAQRPDATAVAGYQTWQALNRQVRRGEKAIRVLAPMVRRSPAPDEKTQPVTDTDSAPDGERGQRIVGFRPVPVFDIAQTDGPPPPIPPQPVLLAGQAPDGLWDALVDEVTERGYRLLRGPIEQLQGANGVTKITEREVWVRDDVDDAQAVKTLTHELAHVILHTDPTQPVGCEGVREVEAESVAHLVMAAHGVDTGTYTFPYVAAWAEPLATAEHKPVTEIVTRTGTRVIQTAHDILDTIPPTAQADIAGEALAERVTAGSERSRELRDHVAATQLTLVGRATLLGVVADSQDFYARQVNASWVADYLAARCLDRAITSHGLGYAPGGWTTLTDHLRGLGYTDEHIEAAGMAVRTRTGNLIDRFRDRLTIPLHDISGDLVGFTGRRSPDVDDPRVPKYLNSPTTALFRKHEILYGLTEHADRLTAGALPVVVEGPLDAIAVDLTAGDQILNWVGVAAVGTAFTDDHARHLRASGGGRICLALDADPAGHAATETAWRQLTNHGPRDIVVALLQDGADPAWMAALAPWALTLSIDAAPSAATVIADRQIDDAHLDDHAGRRVAAFRSLCQYAGRVPTDQRSGFLLHLAQRLHIDPGDAAALTAEQNPTIVMDRITHQARQLEASIHPSANSAVDDDVVCRSDHDHLVRPMTSR